MEDLDESLKSSTSKAKKTINNAIKFLDSIGKCHTIPEIGKERIRRAGKNIKEENPQANGLDIGFRVFKCDESNYKNVAFAPKDYSQESLDLFVDNIKEDRSDLDLLFDCMLRWGITLDLPMTSTKVDGCKIHNVNEGALVACFEGRVTEKVIDAICAMEPNKVVFRDSSFEEAAQKMNLFELFKQKLGWERRRPSAARGRYRSSRASAKRTTCCHSTQRIRRRASARGLPTSSLRKSTSVPAPAGKTA